MACNESCGDGEGDGGVFPGLSRGAVKHGTDKEVEAEGGIFAESLVVTMEGVVATVSSEVLLVEEDDVTAAVALGVPTGLPFCIAWEFSLSSVFTVSLPTSLLTSRTVHSVDTQPGCW